MVVVVGFLFGVCCASFGVGSFMYLLMATKTAKGILYSMNEDAKNKEKRLKAVSHLIDFVKFHLTMKR